MKKLIFSILVSFVFLSCTHSQEKPAVRTLVGGRCEGCEAVFEYGNKKLSPVDTMPDFDSGGNQINITGTIYQPDGKTPAAGVILYIYHTNPQGIYPVKGDETGWAKRHGYIRGWIKTSDEGKYSFYTRKAGSYPGGAGPAHIHPLILEPSGRYYFIEEYYFADDPQLTDRELKTKDPRGGTNGVLHFKMENGMLTAKRDIILGKNIPGY